MPAKAIAPQFADILKDLAQDSKPGNVQYLKDGDTTVKLVLPEGRTDVRQFYERFQATFKQEQFPYYLVAGCITDADEDGVADDTKIRYIKVTKTIMSEIVNLLMKKWDLFGNPGALIVITKGKKAGKASYSVAAIPDTFDASQLPHPEQSIEDAARDQEQRSTEFDNKPAEGESLK